MVHLGIYLQNKEEICVKNSQEKTKVYMIDQADA